MAGKNISESQPRHFSRRDFLRFGALAVAGAGLTAACSPSGKETPTSGATPRVDARLGGNIPSVGTPRISEAVGTPLPDRVTITVDPNIDPKDLQKIIDGFSKNGSVQVNVIVVNGSSSQSLVGEQPKAGLTVTPESTPTVANTATVPAKASNTPTVGTTPSAVTTPTAGATPTTGRTDLICPAGNDPIKMKTGGPALPVNEHNYFVGDGTVNGKPVYDNEGDTGEVLDFQGRMQVEATYGGDLYCVTGDKAEKQAAMQAVVKAKLADPNGCGPDMACSRFDILPESPNSIKIQGKP